MTYSLSPDEGYEQFGNSFAIDPATGQITVQGPLDYEMTSGYVSLTVYAFDNDANIGQAQVQVNIDDVDNDPEFTDFSYSFSIDENALAGTSVGQVQASDPLDETATLTYSWPVTPRRTSTAPRCWSTVACTAACEGSRAPGHPVPTFWAARFVRDAVICTPELVGPGFWAAGSVPDAVICTPEALRAPRWRTSPGWADQSVPSPAACCTARMMPW